jgi:hypothetical protein
LCSVVEPTRENIVAHEPENIVLVYLRRLDSKMDWVPDDLRDLTPVGTTGSSALSWLALKVPQICHGGW